MYKELSSDIDGFKIPDHGYLMGWAKQGEILGYQFKYHMTCHMTAIVVKPDW